MMTTLEEFMPEHPEFFLKSTKHSYKLRLVTLQDHVFLKEKFGSDESIQKIFNEQDWAAICQIVYRLMVDKSDFLAGVESTITDDGDQVEARVTGPQKLLRAITGTQEALEMLGALVKSLTLSNPQVAEQVQKELKKKVGMSKPTGQKSTTRSPVNTASRQPSLGS